MVIALLYGTPDGIPVRNRIGFRLDKEVWADAREGGSAYLVASVSSVGERRFYRGTRLQDTEHRN